MCGYVYTMTSKRTKFTFQTREDSTTRYHCCVPKCAASARCNSALSFFTLPQGDELKLKWVTNIRRDNFAITNHTRICSRHFMPADMKEPSNPQGRRRLRSGAVPVLFEWNHYSLPAPRPGVKEPREEPDCPSEEPKEEPDSPSEHSVDVTTRPDHDYCSSAEPGALDWALSVIEELRAENAALRRQMEEMAISNKFGLERFAASDEDIMFYTKFASYAHLMSFWSQIEPATRDIVHLTRAQTVRPALPTSLQPVDEFFLFMMYLSLGPALKDLAHRFKIHQCTVSRIITTWANLLYTVLGAIGIWLDEETIDQNLPEVFSEYSDTHVILGCTELCCQTPDSLLLQSEVFSDSKSHSTFKGLIGMAPHGPVMFVSPLYQGSISNREILKRSGLVPLLQPSMAIMVDEGFLVEDLVPCKVPAFLRKKKQLSREEVRKTQSIMRLRVHVERVIRRVKEHKLFSTEIPLSLTGCINQLYAVACVLINYQDGPSVKAGARKGSLCLT
uniref:THAP-type domain-containing protein n=1 Tax=Neogobius melanostomus TaxID=47308 RepID=A0A8C6TV66_9GOBI